MPIFSKIFLNLACFQVSQRTSTPTPPPEVNPFAIETDDDACSIHSESGAETKPKKISDAVQDENQKTLLNENERTKKDKSKASRSITNIPI